MQVACERTWQGEVEQDECYRSGKLRENNDCQEEAETWAKERDSLGCSKEKMNQLQLMQELTKWKG